MAFISIIDLDRMELKLERIITKLEIDEFEGYFIAHVPFSINKKDRTILYNIATLEELDTICLFGDTLDCCIIERQIMPDFKKQEYIIKLIL